MIGTLRAGGLPDQVIAYACDLLPLYVMAVAYEESLYAGENVTPEEMREFIADMRRYFASLPADRFPNIVALAAQLTAGDGRRAVRVRARGAGPRAGRDGRVNGRAQRSGQRQAPTITTTPRGAPSRRSPRRACPARRAARP